MKLTVLSCSRDPNSRSRRLAHDAERLVLEGGHTSEFVDLRRYEMPRFDSDTVYATAAYDSLHDSIASADGVIIAAPVYNWELASSAKELLEITGATGVGDRTAAWFDKVITFICTGGLPHSYMAYGAVALSMMLDFKCLVNPYVVYATDRDWSADGELSIDVVLRLQKAIAVQLELSEALGKRSYTSTWEI